MTALSFFKLFSSFAGLHLWHIGKTIVIEGKTFFVAEKNRDKNSIKVVGLIYTMFIIIILCAISN